MRPGIASRKRPVLGPNGRCKPVPPSTNRPSFFAYALLDPRVWRRELFPRHHRLLGIHPPMTQSSIVHTSAVDRTPMHRGSIATLQTFTLIVLHSSAEFVIGKGYAKA